MPTVGKMNISLPKEMGAFVREAVDAGEYATAGEVLRDALRAPKYERLAREVALAELRREVKRGFDSPPDTSFSFEKRIEEIRAAPNGQ